MSWFIVGGLVVEDKNEWVSLLVSGFTALVESVKVFCILAKPKEIRQMVLDVGAHPSLSREEFLTHSLKLNYLVNFSMALIASTSVAVLNTMIFYTPMFSSTKRFPLNMWFPFDVENNDALYWAVYIYTLLSLIICIVSVTLSILLWYIMMNCAIKYEIIGNQFKNLIAKKPTNLGLHELITLIEEHRKHWK